MIVKVVNRSGNALPAYETPLAAGMDLRADISESLVIKPLSRALVPTGLYVELPDGYEMQIRPRSGLAAKFGLTVLNSPGTVDADYRGELRVILANLSDTDFEVRPGERIAQAVVSRFERIEWQGVSELSATGRGEGGFGSTG